jgi:hypothetical protein
MLTADCLAAGLEETAQHGRGAPESWNRLSAREMSACPNGEEYRTRATPVITLTATRMATDTMSHAERRRRDPLA